jgi:hypothetical protein
MLLHAILLLSVTLLLPIESSLSFHLFQVALITPFPTINEMAFALQ